MTMQYNRLLYPDICKFLAISLVTCSHCAQYLSGETWTNFFFGSHLDIAFNMPLFMLISGWFIDLNKMRTQKPFEFVMVKFKRLMIPAFVWWGILFTVTRPSSSPLSFYWYLTALFACLCIIFVFSKYVKNDTVLMVISTVFVLLCPKTDYANINFMFPFLWAGFLISKIYNSRYGKWWFIISLIIGVVFSMLWHVDYSIYRSKFIIQDINVRMVAIYIYRFVLGVALSSVIIYLVKKFEYALSSVAQLGQYSLAVYTGSFVINAIIAIFLNHIGYHTNKLLLIDVLSLAMCIVIYTLIVAISIVCRKNKITRLLFLGE